MKKRNKQIYISDKILYIFICLGILVVICAGVYAASYSSSGGGHPYEEISTCGANQVLKMNSAGTAWTCQADAVGTGGITVETDPTVDRRVKDGVSWGDLRSVPPGWSDGDEVGLRRITTYTSSTYECFLDETNTTEYCTATCPEGTILTGCAAQTSYGIGEIIPRTGRTGSCTCSRVLTGTIIQIMYCDAICLVVSSY